MALRQTFANKYGVAKWIVDPVASSGTHTTITAALADASAGDTIFIRDGTFTENLTGKAGVNLVSFGGEGITPNVTIKGKFTATYTGNVTISGIRLQTNGDFCITSTGSNSLTLSLENCFIDGVDNAAVNNSNANANIFFRFSQGSFGAFAPFTHSAGRIETRFCTFEGTNTPSLISGGQFQGFFCSFVSPFTASSSGNLNLRFCNFSSGTTALTYNDTSFGDLYFCRLNVGSASGIISNTSSSIGVQALGCIINTSGATATSGSGRIFIDMLGVVNNASAAITTTTVLHYPMYTGTITLNNNVKFMSGTGSPNGSVTAPKGSYFARLDGSSSSTRAYINTNSGTSWTAITTVA